MLYRALLPHRMSVLFVAAVAIAAFVATPLFAAEPLVAEGEAPEPNFNRLMTFEAIETLLDDYAKAYPEWIELESIGQSAEGRTMWLLTLTNPTTGPALQKPAMYIDGNIHANEVQGAEATLYVLDFLLSNYGHLTRVTDLLDRLTFYFVPVVNPDGRAAWFRGPSTPHFPRTVMVAVDDDRDGLADEDGFDDLDGDGVITQMRMRVPLGEGTHRLDRDDPRLLHAVEGEERGDYILLGGEGFDNDGDGQVNEDLVGYVDPNRTWGYEWQPPYVQAGAGAYPLSIPETRAIALWAVDHPNIAGVQSFHNTGGMILRGPGAKSHPRIPRGDLLAYDLLGEEGEKLLPGYEYLISWKDLYTTWGDTTDHFYRIHGAIALTNELYTEEHVVDLDGDGEVTDDEETMFNDVLTLGRRVVEWKEVEHPQYGTVEIGGNRHDVGRVPENWLLEEEVHRNAAFVLFHAYHLPKLTIGEPKVEKLDRKLHRIEVPVLIERATPSVSAAARQAKAHRFDLATIDGATVVAAGVVDDPYLHHIQWQEHRPERLMVSGIPGQGSKRLVFLVEGGGEVTVRYDSLKGGVVERAVTLE